MSDKHLILGSIQDLSNPAFNALATDHARLTQELARKDAEIADLKQSLAVSEKLHQEACDSAYERGDVMAENASLRAALERCREWFVEQSDWGVDACQELPEEMVQVCADALEAKRCERND